MATFKRGLPVTTLIACSLAILLGNFQPAVGSLIVDKIPTFFRIKEHTKNEYVACGSNGNILRWGWTGGNDQLWLFLPEGGNSYRIMTLTNGEYLAVGGTGNILRWGWTGKNDQLFSLVNQNGNTFNIQEHTRNEFMAVGWWGNILRWSRTGGNDQKFTLVPYNNPAKPGLPKTQYEPGQIPQPPQLKSYDPSSVPLETTPVVVGSSHVLCTLVTDRTYSDKITQMRRNPYYIAVRTQHWSRKGNQGYTYQHSHGQSQTFTRKVIYEVSQKTTRSTEETWNTKFSVNAEMSATVSKGPASVTATRGMSFEISHGLKISTVDEKSSVQRTETTVTRSYDSKTPKFTVIGWTLINTYTLKRADGSVVSSSAAGLNNLLVTTGYPANLDVAPK